jgi:hypothetical protein
MRTKCRSIATFHRPIHSHWSLPLTKVLMTKNWKIYSWNFFLLFLIRNCNLLFPRPPKQRPSYRKSLQPWKENIQHLKQWNLLTFFYFCASFFALLDPNPYCKSQSGSRDPWYPDPIRIGIHNTGHAKVSNTKPRIFSILLGVIILWSYHTKRTISLCSNMKYRTQPKVLFLQYRNTLPLVLYLKRIR